MICRASCPSCSERYQTHVKINRKIRVLIEAFGSVVPEGYFTDPDQFIGNPWIYFCNGYFEIYLYLKLKG